MKYTTLRAGSQSVGHIKSFNCEITLRALNTSARARMQLNYLYEINLFQFVLDIKIDRLTGWLSDWVRTNLSQNLHTENGMRLTYAYAHANQKALRTQSINFLRSVNEKKNLASK